MSADDTASGVVIGPQVPAIYRSVKPNGKTWGEARSLQEVLERSKGMDVTIEVERIIVAHIHYNEEDFTPHETRQIEEWRKRDY